MKQQNAFSESTRRAVSTKSFVSTFFFRRGGVAARAGRAVLIETPLPAPAPHPAIVCEKNLDE
ncbi:hypothetical protein JYU34_015812, partial [Plutella xylostella]